MNNRGNRWFVIQLASPIFYSMVTNASIIVHEDNALIATFNQQFNEANFKTDYDVFNKDLGFLNSALYNQFLQLL